MHPDPREYGSIFFNSSTYHPLTSCASGWTSSSASGPTSAGQKRKCTSTTRKSLSLLPLVCIRYGFAGFVSETRRCACRGRNSRRPPLQPTADLQSVDRRAHASHQAICGLQSGYLQPPRSSTGRPVRPIARLLPVPFLSGEYMRLIIDP